MMEKERSFIHQSHTKQKKCDTDLQEHTQFLKQFPDDSNAHIEERSKKLHENASNCSKKKEKSEKI